MKEMVVTHEGKEYVLFYDPNDPEDPNGIVLFRIDRDEKDKKFIKQMVMEKDEAVYIAVRAIYEDKEQEQKQGQQKTPAKSVTASSTAAAAGIPAKPVAATPPQKASGFAKREQKEDHKNVKAAQNVLDEKYKGAIEIYDNGEKVQVKKEAVIKLNEVEYAILSLVDDAEAFGIYKIERATDNKLLGMEAEKDAAIADAVFDIFDKQS
jgi:hypothetical protein